MMWHAAKRPGATSRRSGQTSAHSFLAMKQRVWKRHPGGGEIGEGISPERTIRSDGASPSIGTADSSERVYGCSGRQMS